MEIILFIAGCIIGSIFFNEYYRRKRNKVYKDHIKEFERLRKDINKLFKNIKLDRLYYDICRNVVKFGDCFTETIIDVNNKALKKKSNKVHNNKMRLQRDIINKPINLNCEDKIFSSFIKNEIEIIKNY